MTLHVIDVYHNADSRFFPYEPGHTLTQVITHWRHLPATAAPEQLADWAFHVFNADLDHLETERATPNGEADFLIACTYRLLRLRSLSTGDVVAVTANGHTTWLACEFVGWKRIGPPTSLTGGPLTAATVYQHLRRGRHA
ncbi:hypothetical protein JMF97_29275 [Micromonospora fiedleri]|uniref:Uncharacterized protein n=1 Tax=Micromonospora fiedleri TaxID=1157498 RepID=A0ABS1UV66_9ACTN|nr:hypothetical protein [Micromonospora fiedleri]MBL6280260.1 hypothetical protein [Micromonospora fiedleri]